MAEGTGPTTLEQLERTVDPQWTARVLAVLPEAYRLALRWLPHLPLEEVVELDDRSLWWYEDVGAGLGAVYSWSEEIVQTRRIAVVPISLIKDTLRHAQSVFPNTLQSVFLEPLGRRLYFVRELDESRISIAKLFLALQVSAAASTDATC